MRAMLRWHGGKNKIGGWVIAHLPPHQTYVEPFAGAASVLLRKPRSYAEVLNDLDGEVVNLFRVLQEADCARELQRILRLTPFAREEFRLAMTPDAEPVERARRLIIRSFMGHGTTGATRIGSTGFRDDVWRARKTPMACWADYPDHLAAFTARLSGVMIENRPATEMVPCFDRPDTLYYVDPPYPMSTRCYSKRHVYRHEMTDDDHRALASTLKGCTGMVVLSGYHCPLYDQELYRDWWCTERRTHADSTAERTEVLWFNAIAARNLQQKSLVFS